MQGTYKGWTITAREKVDNGRDFTVPVTMVNGERTENLSFGGIVSRNGLVSAIRNWIDNDENKASMNDTSDLVFVAPKAPATTKAELNKAAWEADWAKLQGLQQYIDAGVFDGTETPIVNLRNKVKTGFKPAYLDL